MQKHDGVATFVQKKGFILSKVKYSSPDFDSLQSYPHQLMG